MNSYFQKNNTDGVFFRDFFISVLKIFDDNLQIPQIINNEEVLTTIPFLPEASGDERFWQDIFLQTAMNSNSIIKQRKAEGNIDIVPRGHLHLTSVEISESEITSNFSYVKFQQEEDGVLKIYVAPCKQVPLKMNIDVEIRIDGTLMMFKVLEEIIDIFYKMHPIKFLSKGMVIPAMVGFSANNNLEKSTQFSFGEVTEKKITFPLECETYYPILSMKFAQEFTNSMQSFVFNNNLDDNLFQQNKNSSIYNLNKTPKVQYGNVFIGDNTFANDPSDLSSDLSADNDNCNVSNSVVEQILTDKNVWAECIIGENEVELEFDPNSNLPVMLDEDHNIHNVGEFGIPTQTLNDDLTLSK